MRSPTDSTAPAALAALLTLAALVASCVDSPVTPRESGSRVCGNRAVSLAVGEVAIPASVTQRRCLLSAEAGAEYAVAWVDLRAIDGAKVGPEPSFEPYPLRLSIVSAPAMRGVAEARAEAPEAVPGAVPTADDTPLESRPRHRRTPWVLDELFLLDDERAGLPREARVVRIYGGQAVVARWESDPTTDLDLYLAQLDSAYAIADATMRPLWRHVFADTFPTSTQAGQYLLLLAPAEQTPAQARAEISGDTLYTWLELSPFPWPRAVELANQLAHEMTHSYQHLYMHASRGTPGLPSVPAASFWGYEGTANLMSYEFVRRRSEIPFNGNHDWRMPATSWEMGYYQRRAQPAGGVLTLGYDNAMGFLRDLAIRRMAQGEALDDALRSVARGAIEGWYGLDGITSRSGLVARMRASLGNAWEPADALLDWTLSHAGDELTPNPRYQDRASLRVWDLTGISFGWRPDVVLTRATPTHFLFKTYGSPGWLRVTDDGAGLDVEVEGFEVPILWKILRVR